MSKKRSRNEMIEFRQSASDQTFSLPAGAVSAASPVLAEIIAGDLTDAYIPEDCPLQQLEAFTGLLSLQLGNGKRNLTYAQLRENPERTMANALPLIHKYEAEGLKELCFTTINEQPGVDSIATYDSMYEDTVWPEKTLKWFLTNTMGYELRIHENNSTCSAHKSFTNKRALKRLRPDTLVMLLALCNSDSHEKSTKARSHMAYMRNGLDVHQVADNCIGQEWVKLSTKKA